MLKKSKALIALLLTACFLITAAPVFAADATAAAAPAAADTSTVAAPAFVEGYDVLAINFDGVTENPFTGGANQVENIAVADGAVSGTSVGGDPFVMYSSIGLDASKVDKILITLAAESTSTAFQFFFTTETIGWSEDASFKYDFAKAEKDADGYFVIALDASTCAEWKGKITNFRIDPFSAEGTFSIKSIVFRSNDETVQKVTFSDKITSTVPFDKSGDVDKLYAALGYLFGTSKGGDPYINYTGNFGFAASSVGAIHFKMKSFSANKNFQLFFTTETIGWSEAASFKVDLSTYKPDQYGWIHVEIDTSTCAEWKGNITGLRLDAMSGKGVFVFGSINFDVHTYAEILAAAAAEEDADVVDEALITATAKKFGWEFNGMWVLTCAPWSYLNGFIGFPNDPVL